MIHHGSPHTAVTIVGAYGAGNLGDDALLASVLTALRGIVSDNRVCIRTLHRAPYVAQWFPDVTVVSSGDSVRVRTNLLLFGGGTQFYSFANACATRGRRLRSINKYLLRPRLLWRRLRMVGTFQGIVSDRTAAVSVGIGPFVPGSFQEERARALLRSCDWISVRDTLSLGFCGRWGITRALLYPDLCFASELWGFDGLTNPGIGSAVARVGVIVRDWPRTIMGQAYFEPLRKAVAQMRAEGLAVTYLSLGVSSDSKTVRTLEQAGEKVVKWDPGNSTVVEFAERLRSFHLLITARVHAVIIGATLGIPSIAIGIEPKLEIVREQLGAGTRGWAPPFDPDVLLSQVREISRTYPRVCETVITKASACACQARESVRRLRRYVDSVVNG